MTPGPLAAPDAPDARNAPAPTADDAIALLRELLTGTTLRALKGTRPVAIWLDGRAWTVDARSPQFVVDGVHAPALTLRTTPRVLVRLLTEPDLVLGADDFLDAEGDPRALQPLIEALRGGKSPLAARIAAHMGR